jgi:spore coat protein CotF
MNISLTTKERMLLEDQKMHEEICIEKYNNYAQQATDPQLKNIFSNHAKIEQEHLNTINQLLGGQVPAMSQQGGGGQNGSQGNSQQAGGMQGNSQQAGSMQQQQGGSSGGSQLSTGMQQQHGGSQLSTGMQQQPNQSAGLQLNSVGKATDQSLCNDMLMTEKYVSGAYDTAIFEFKDTQVRDVLNHIQKEEQKHGESIFKYMESQGTYTPK